ncbi:MAG: PAS domain S-box protein [Planctomycetes bacterium]|nr:PAS domain S-box protein [Planctomycetota bacterium]
MEHKPTEHGAGRRAAKYIGASCAYLASLVAVRFALNAAEVNSDTVLWDPTAGMAFAMLLVAGVRYAPAVFAGAMATLIIHYYPISHHGPGLWSYVTAGVQTAAYSAGAWLLTKAPRFDRRLSAQRDVLYYAAIGLITPVAPAVFNAQRHFEPARFASASLHFWVTDAIGILTVGPLLLLAWCRWREGVPREERRMVRDTGAWTWLEWAAQLALLVAGVWATFVLDQSSGTHARYLVLPPVVWMLMRRGTWGAVVASSFVGVLSMVATRLVKSDDAEVLDTQAFMLVVSISTLFLGALSSGRRRVEHELAESEKRYRVLFENSPHPLLVYDRNTLKFLDVNRAAEQVYGYTRDEFLAMTLADVRPADEKPIAMGPASVTPPTMQRSGVWRHRRKDGSLIEVDIATSPMKPLGPTARLVLARDVTETRKAERARMEAESALRVALQRLVSHVENSPLAVIEWDRDFKVCRWSGGAERIFGWSASELMGRNPLEWKFVYEEDLPGVERVMLGLSSGTQPRNSSINRNYTKAGGVRYCEWYNSVLMDDSGLPVSVLSLVSDVTERVEAQRALRSNEERFELVVRGSNDGVWDWDIAHESLYWSPRFHQLMGDAGLRLTPTFDEWARRVHPADWPEVMARLRAHLETRSVYDVEYRFLHSSGGWRWHRASGQAVWDANGNATRMAGSVSDITDRRRAQEQLEETAEKYQTLVETTGTGYAVSDEHGRIIDANAEYVRFTGHSTLEEILGRRVLEWTAPADAERNEASFETLRKTGYIRGLEVDYQDHTGRTTPVEVNASLVSSAAGARVLALVRDITYRRRAEAVLQEWKSRYEAAAAASRQLVYELVHDTGEILWGGPCEPLFGCSDAQLSDLERWVERVHPDDRAAYEESKKRLSAERGTFHLEYRVRRQDNTYVHVEDTARFFTDALGRATRMVGFVADITERVKDREELDHRARELARSNAELERFAYVASHDLQEPLRMVTSFTQLLGDRYRGKLDADADEFIGYAVEGATRMRRLIDDLLTYSRVGSTPRRLARVSVKDAVSRALANLRTSIAESGAAIEVGELPVVTADELQLTLVFQNLLGNAIKFRREGAAPVVRVWSEQEPGRWRVFVRDNGIGIEAKHRDRVFTMFQRLNPRSRYAGNGIGLTICKKIVEDMGGAIMVDAAPDCGCVFSFTIPERVRARPDEQEVSP